MEEATREARRRLDRARELAAQALTHFDRQCELGDDGALAERGAALMLMGQMLPSAQSYDAYLRAHPPQALDARTRRRVEANLQPGVVTIEADGEAHLFVDDLHFGPLPRSTPVRLPLGDHRLEARADDGTVLATAEVSLTAEAPAITVPLSVPRAVTVAPPPDDEPPPAAVAVADAAPQERVDFLPYYLAAGGAALVGLGLGIGLVVAADERARTYNSLCSTGLATVESCNAVLAERDLDLGIGVAGFVLAGLGGAAVGVIAVLDLGQAPRGAVRLSGGLRGLSISGSF